VWQRLGAAPHPHLLQPATPLAITTRILFNLLSASSRALWEQGRGALGGFNYDAREVGRAEGAGLAHWRLYAVLRLTDCRRLAESRLVFSRAWWVRLVGWWGVGWCGVGWSGVGGLHYGVLQLQSTHFERVCQNTTKPHTTTTTRLASYLGLQHEMADALSSQLTPEWAARADVDAANLERMRRKLSDMAVQCSEFVQHREEVVCRHTLPVAPLPAAAPAAAPAGAAAETGAAAAGAGGAAGGVRYCVGDRVDCRGRSRKRTFLVAWRPMGGVEMFISYKRSLAGQVGVCGGGRGGLAHCRALWLRFAA